MITKPNDDGTTPEHAVSAQTSNGSRGGPTGPLALDLTEEAVVLCARGSDGSVDEIARAPLDAADFSAQIEALRTEAARRDTRQRPVTLWLPEAQILMRRMSLGSKQQGSALAEVALRLQSETEHRAEDLSIDVSLGQDDSPSIVLAALVQTVREAKEYAAKWGFVPGLVSTRCHAEVFGPRLPVFNIDEPEAAKAGKRKFRFAAAAALVVGAGIGGWAYYDSQRETSVAPAIPDVPARTARSFKNADTTPNVRLTSLDSARPDFAGFPKPPSADAPDTVTTVGIETASLPAAATKVAEIVAAPESMAQLAIGAEPTLPSHSAPARPGEIEATIADVGIADAKAAIDQIRAQSSELPEQSAPGNRPTSSEIADAGLLPEAIQGDNAQAPGSIRESDPAMGGMADAAPASIEGTDTPDAAELAQSAQPEQGTGSSESGELADTNPNLPLPKPRPTVATEDKEDAQTVESAEASETDGEALAAQTEGDPDAASPDEEIVAEPEATSGDAEEVLAVAESPMPVKRPEHLSAPDVQQAASRKAKAKPIAAGPSPASVSSAAGERGLQLDETSLIGVIDTSAGRSALVRLPDGDFRKLTRGDDLDGWRVSSIGRDRIRLTRQGRNRTLNLVSR